MAARGDGSRELSRIDSVGRADVSHKAARALHGCHYSPTGGGLLTPYGRLLSHRELSTTGGTATAPAAGAEDDPHGEQAFLYGVLGNALGPVHLWLEMRPAHLRIDFPGGSQDMNFLMNLDLIGAVQKKGWTAYGTVGREPPNSAVRNGRTLPDAAFISYEHWIAYETDQAFRIFAAWRSRQTCCRARTGTSVCRPTTTTRSMPVLRQYWRSFTYTCESRSESRASPSSASSGTSLACPESSFITGNRARELYQVLRTAFPDFHAEIHL